MKKKTVVGIIRECLDSNICSESQILSRLENEFQDIHYSILRKRIRPGIDYINQERFPVSEFEFKGLPKKIEHQFKIIESLRIIKEKTDLRFVKFIWKWKLRSCYKHPGRKDGDVIILGKKYWEYRNDNSVLGILLHELVHANGFYGHGPEFFSKLLEVGIKCNLDLDAWFSTEYSSLKRLYSAYRLKPGVLTPLKI